MPFLNCWLGMFCPWSWCARQWLGEGFKDGMRTGKASAVLLISLRASRGQQWPLLHRPAPAHRLLNYAGQVKGGYGGRWMSWGKPEDKRRWVCRVERSLVLQLSLSQGMWLCRGLRSFDEWACHMMNISMVVLPSVSFWLSFWDAEVA